MIELGQSLLVAQEILNRLIHESGHINGWVDTFDNCREQGYRVTAYNKKVNLFRTIAFAQDRNTDMITLFFMEGSAFNLDECSNRKFNYNGTHEAVQFIKDYLSK